VPAPPQVSGEVQVPHELTVRVAPQLSVPVTLPQFLPRRVQKAAFVSAVQVDPPHTFAVPPPPQVWGEVQVPQLSVPPHPSLMDPQFLLCAAQLVGVQVPPVVSRRTGLFASSRDPKVTLRSEAIGAVIMKVATPSVSCCTLEVTSYSIHVPAVAAVMLVDAI
jgi:hypothetical protein